MVIYDQKARERKVLKRPKKGCFEVSDNAEYKKIVRKLRKLESEHKREFGGATEESVILAEAASTLMTLGAATKRGKRGCNVFIKLTEITKKKEIYLNVNTISSVFVTDIAEDGDAARVFLAGETAPWYVCETVEEVMEKIRASEER